MLLIALLPRLVVPGRFTPVRYLMNRQARFPNPQFILSCPVVGPAAYQLVWRPPAVTPKPLANTLVALPSHQSLPRRPRLGDIFAFSRSHLGPQPRTIPIA